MSVWDVTNGSHDDSMQHNVQSWILIIMVKLILKTRLMKERDPMIDSCKICVEDDT
jgi:hypothetical protein